MKSNIMYDHSTALPNISQGHFHRWRIDNMMKELLSRQLIVVAAGAGWGKTHAVSSFLRNAPVRYIWFQLSELDNHLNRFWEEFVYIMEHQNKDSAKQMEQLGFPETLGKFNKFLHILAKEIYSRNQVVFVFDDFHFIHDEPVLRFIENLIYARLENFSIIIISRTKLKLNITTMLVSDIAGHVTMEDLRFSTDETKGYFKGKGISLSTRELEKVQSFTEGWPLALYLVALSIKNSGVFLKDTIAGAMPLIFEMIEQELFMGYTKQIKKFLIRVSLLSSFPNVLIKELAKDCSIGTLEPFENNMFIYYNAYTGYYNIHHLFLDFLCRKHGELDKEEKADTYLKAAKWCVSNDLKLEAFAYYDKCGCYDEILDIMLNFGVAIFSKTSADFYISLIDKFPPELVEMNPIIHVHHAGLLHNNAETQLAIAELYRAKDKLETSPLTDINKNILGEIYCMLGLINLAVGNYDFVNQLKKACEYLYGTRTMIDNTGRVLNTRYAIMFSKPEPGELEKMEEALFYTMPDVSKSMGGYGYGLEYLASAEAAYFTQDMTKAFKNAYEAIYRARSKHVSDVIYSGYFLLMRIEAASGNHENVLLHLEQMKAYAEEFNERYNFNGMPDVAEGWFNIMTGHPEKVARWIVDDDLGGSVLAPYSMGMERQVKARYFYMEGRYFELLAWLGQSEGLFRKNDNWLVLLDILIYKAVASHYIKDGDGAYEALLQAYEISHANNIIMQFVELGSGMRAVINKIRCREENSIPKSWLSEIYTKALSYDKHMRGMKSLYRKKPEFIPKLSAKLTKRESEMLKHLCQGLTNTDIASACFVSVSAVKKTVNNIYIKLGATNRADAVRIAIQMELNK